MAIYFQNTLMRVSDFIKVSPKYSSAQSVSRAKTKKLLPTKTISGISFVNTDAALVSKIFSVTSWDKLQVIEAHQLPPSLKSFNKIRVSAGVSETQIIEWGFFNKMDVYWIGGTFFANPVDVKQLASTGR